jgi:hypothetical protein
LEKLSKSALSEASGRRNLKEKLVLKFVSAAYAQKAAEYRNLIKAQTAAKKRVSSK